MTSTGDTFECFCEGGPRRTRGGRCIDCDGTASLGANDVFDDLGRCGGCQATIGWVTNRFGRPLALDIEPSEEGDVELHRTGAGVTLVRELDELETALAQERGATLYRQHRESCPSRDRFKRGSRRRGGSRA